MLLVSLLVDEENKLNEKGKQKRAIQIAKYGDPPKGFDENYIKAHYKDVESGLSLFINDPLIFPPNTDYEYSSLAYSLISRIIEKVSGQSYVNYMGKILTELDMCSTVVDLNDPLIFGRAK